MRTKPGRVFVLTAIASRPRRCSLSFGQSVAAFLSQPGLPFSKILTEQRIHRIFARHDGLFGRVYTTPIVLWAFMSQVLRDGKEAACRSAVSRINSHLQLTTGRGADPDTRDYCRARAKLPEEALHALATAIAEDCETEVDSRQLFHGRHAKLIDGSTFQMADTPENQKMYPQNSAQQPGIGFPIARMVVVISLATACVIDAAIGKYAGKETSEMALLRKLLSCFERGDVAVADRFYGNYWMIALLLQHGVDVCFRKHQRRKTDFRTGRRLGRNDHLVTWQRPGQPAWMSDELYASLPESLTLREIRYVISEPGRRHQPFVIVTTLYHDGPQQDISHEDISELFGFRWNAELDLRSVKTHMNLNHLRCKTPEMVHREFWTTIIAYNAIRMTAACSAQLSGDTAPREISFVGTCQHVLAAWDVIVTGSLTGQQLQQYCRQVLTQISKCRVAQRPGRIEPRVRKKRSNNYKLMMQPRKTLRERLARGDNVFESK
jgi:hypothetical protein